MVKKFLFFMMAAMVAVGSFTSCSSDDDDNPTNTASIVGTWVNSSNGAIDEIQYKADGTCNENMTLDNTSAKMRYSGNYNLNGNKLTIHWTTGQGWNPITESWMDLDDPEETVVITISIDGNKLTYLSMEGEEQNEPVVYTRK